MLTKNQQLAIELSQSKSFLIISGGPGVGKTTVTREIVKILDYDKICLLAPTGKAALVMNDSIQYNGTDIYCKPRTIAYVLHCQALIDYYQRCIVIIDEISMVSRKTLYEIMHLLHPNKIILVGDRDQLPPVQGCGVLYDLMDCEMVNKVILSEVHRQRANSSVLKNLEKIRKNEIKEISDFVLGDDFHVIVTDMWASKIRAFKDSTFLCFTNKSRYQLNIKLQEIHNPFGKNISCNRNCKKNEGKITPRVGDRIICNSNLYDDNDSNENNNNDDNNNDDDEEYGEDIEDDGDNPHNEYVDMSAERKLLVSNGMMGKVVKDKFTGQYYIEYYNSANEVIYTDKRDLKTKSYKTSFEVGYAITVHKAQGDQYKNTCIVLDSSYASPTHSLLYTAISRTIERCVMIGDTKAFKNVISGTPLTKRLLSRNDKEKNGSYFFDRLENVNVARKHAL